MESQREKSWLRDFHLPSLVNIDGRMNEEDAIERASSKSMREISLTNKIFLIQPDNAMSPGSCLSHWKMIQECQVNYPHLHIRLGLEMDYYLDCIEEMSATFERILANFIKLLYHLQM